MYDFEVECFVWQQVEKNLKQLEKLWKEMKTKRVAPDKVTYTTIIGAYSKEGQFETCVKLFNEYRMNEGLIDRAMAGIMLGIFLAILDCKVQYICYQL